MGTQSDKNIHDLNGQWTMDNSLSDPFDPILKLQGLGLVKRTVITKATITLDIKHYAEPQPGSGSGSGSGAPVEHVDIDQTATGGIKGSSECRVLDWEERLTDDVTFGKVKHRSQFAKPTEVPKLVCTRLRGDDAQQQQQQQMDEVRRFLAGKVLIDGSPSDGFVGDGDGNNDIIHCWMINEESGWTAEQTWGFEIVNGERRHTRRSVVASVKQPKFEKARLVYAYKGSPA